MTVMCMTKLAFIDEEFHEIKEW